MAERDVEHILGKGKCPTYYLGAGGEKPSSIGTSRSRPYLTWWDRGSSII
jgi:hypothetical protein